MGRATSKRSMFSRPCSIEEVDVEYWLTSGLYRPALVPESDVLWLGPHVRIYPYLLLTRRFDRLRQARLSDSMPKVRDAVVCAGRCASAAGNRYMWTGAHKSSRASHIDRPYHVRSRALSSNNPVPVRSVWSSQARCWNTGTSHRKPRRLPWQTIRPDSRTRSS